MVTKRYRHWLAKIGLILGACLAAAQPVLAQDRLLIKNARLIDGTGAAPREKVSILISGGRIVEIADTIDAGQAKVIDAGGYTLIPGLIDTHVHLASVPGAGFRDDSPELTEELMRFHLRAYLASGVTSVLDTAIPMPQARLIMSWRDAGYSAPRVLMLAPTFSTAQGYLADSAEAAAIYFEPVGSAAEVEAKFEEAQSIAPAGVKVLLESGFGMGRLPIHDAEIRAAIVSGAKKRNLPLYIHSTSPADQAIALDMGAYAHVHGASFGANDLIDRLKEAPAYMMSTLSIQDAWTMASNRERLKEDLFRQNVPGIELETASQQAAWDNLNRQFMAMVFPPSPASQTPPAGAGQPPPSAPQQQDSGTDANTAALNLWLSNMKKIRDAGLPIVMGSDSGNWPVIPGMFHGPTSLREIELLGMAGLTPMEALIAATKTPAQMLKLSEQIGTVEVGKAADLVILREDPLQDLRALREIEWTIIGGVAKTPAQWLEE